MSRGRSIFTSRSGFTLIELLIVVAIIAILAAIAVPNFMEAQTRSKISRGHADMRAVEIAMEAYRVDFNNTPKTTIAGDPKPAYSSWWGFTPYLLTTPMAYMTTMPAMAFSDEMVLGFWTGLDSKHNSQGNQPYTMIRDTSVSRWTVGASAANNPKYQQMGVKIPQEWRDKQDKADFVLYTCGPDRMDSTVWGSPAFYDPSNGTVSFGEIYRFGGGDANNLKHNLQ